MESFESYEKPTKKQVHLLLVRFQNMIKDTYIKTSKQIETIQSSRRNDFI